MGRNRIYPLAGHLEAQLGHGGKSSRVKRVAPRDCFLTVKGRETN